MKRIESNNSVEIFNTVKEVINHVETILKDERYELSGSLTQFKTMDMMKVVSELGVRDKKRLKRRLNKIISKNTLKSINSLLRFLSKKSNIDIVRIDEPKHEEIQKLRKDWKVLQAQSDAALLKYKNLKGDYYKIIIEQKQAA